jgi:hypothetical protein
VFIGVACAAASMFSVRTGLFSFFFLLPLGLAAFLADAKTAWASGIFAIAGNIVISLRFAADGNVEPGLVLWSILYYSVMVLAFTWINAPLGRLGQRLEIPYRMILGAIFCTLVIGAMFLSIMDDGVLIRLLADRIGSTAELPGAPTAEQLVSTMVYAALRGGILVSCMVFWWVNRQIAAGIVRMVKHVQIGGNPFAFHVPLFFIWIFSLALGAVLLGTVTGLEPVEIGGWNVLVLSGILYFIQGVSIAFHYLVKLPPLMRILINVGVILLLLTPGINMVVLGLLVILGIVENWAPLRANLHHL